MKDAVEFLYSQSWFTGVLFIGGLLFAWYAVRVSRHQPKPEHGPPLSLFERDRLELYELAYLSVDKTPQSRGMPRDVIHRHRLLKDAVTDGKLVVENLNVDGKPNVMTRVRLDDFASFARNTQPQHADFIRLAEKWSEFHNTHIPLKDAARSLYEDLRSFDNQHAQILMAQSGNASPEKVLDYFAITIFQRAEIFGKRPPSDKLEKIPQDAMDHAHFVNGGISLKQFDKNNPEYVDLVVNKNDLPRILDWLKSQNKFG